MDLNRFSRPLLYRLMAGMKRDAKQRYTWVYEWGVWAHATDLALSKDRPGAVVRFIHPRPLGNGGW